MKHHARLVAAVAAALLCGLTVSLAPARSGSPLQPTTVTTWPWVDPYGSFAEGLALGPDVALYASLTTWGDESDTGQIVRIALPGGAQTAFGPAIATPGLLTGVAFDSQGRLYVASATFSDDDLPGVFRVDATHATRVLTLPAGSFPNGLAIRGGNLYVSDSALGAIWRAGTDAKAAPTTPWLQDARLLPSEEIGANGIAFRGNDLYVAVADSGRILRTTIRPGGAPSPLVAVAQADVLRSADGIAFDQLGNLWVAVNGPDSGRLVKLTTTGTLAVFADRPAWLDYPTQPVFVPSAKTLGLYVENGSYMNGGPNVVAFGGPLVP
jgi:sugar lactone lactonase YvrE